MRRRARRLPPLRIDRTGETRARIAAATSPRFASIAIAVWNGLPLRARFRLLRHWRARAEAPAVVFMDRVLSDDGHDCYAACSSAGFELQFDRADAARLPDRVVAAVLVHELAHVAQLARGEPMDEGAARALAEQWGRGWRSEYDRLWLAG